MATSSEIAVTEAYIGLLGRAPDPAGLAYWAEQLDNAIAAGQSQAVALKKLTNDITLSAEWDSGIGANDASTLAGAEAVVRAMYNNLFDRDSTGGASQAEVDYWAPRLVSGEFTASEMAVALIVAAQNDGGTDGSVLSFKQQAATYYVETVPSENFSNESAQEAVDDVNGPISLSDSKTATDYVATGVGVTTELTKAATPANVTMTAGDDVVTGTVGTGATYTTQNILDTSSADSDTVTLTGDAGFTIDDITKVEAININLSDTVGGGFTINAAKALNSTINLDVADTVTIEGVELTGETAATVSNLASTDLNTTDVTKLTVSTGGGAANISTDADASIVDVSGIDANDTSLTLAAKATTVGLDGTTGTKDAISISAAGAVTLDVDDAGLGGDLVEALTLSGNGAAATFTVSNAGAGLMTYNVTGDQDVTLAGTGAMFTAQKFSDTSTAGDTTLALSSSGGGDVDVSTWGVLSGGIELTGSFGANTLMAASGNTIKISADQAANIGLDTNDGGTSSSLTLDIDNDTKAITTTDVDALTIQTGDRVTKIDGVLNAGDNDAEVLIVGTNDVQVTGKTSSGDLTVSGVQDAKFQEIDADGELDVTASQDFIATAVITVDNDATISANDVDIQVGITTAASSATDGNIVLTATEGDVDVAGAIDADGTLTITAGDSFTHDANALNAENDVKITADDATTTTGGGTVTVQAGSLTIETANDIDLNDTVSVTGGGVTLTQTATTGKIDTTGATITASNDIDITGQNVKVVALTTTDGDIDVTAQNDIDFDGNVTAVRGDAASGNLTATTKEANDGNIDATGFTLKADNDLTLTAGDKLTTAALTTVEGDAVLTAGNEVVIGVGATASDIDGLLTVTTGTNATGTITISGAIVADNDVEMTGNTVNVGKDVTSNKDDIIITASNDVVLNGGDLLTPDGSVSVDVTGRGTLNLDFTATAATDVITASNDVTVKADDVQVGDVTSSDVGNIVLTATNDVRMTGDVKATAEQGNITVTAGGAVTLTAGKAIEGENDVTVTAQGTGTVTLNSGTIKSDGIGDITLTGGNLTGSGAITADDGDITINSTNDAALTDLDGTITATTGSVSIISGKHDIEDIDADTGGITIAGDSTGNFGALSAVNSQVRITGTGDVATATIDAEAVVGSGTGDMDLGTVTSTSASTDILQITTGTGDDSMTLNAAGDEYRVNTGAGDDSVIATATKANSVVQLGNGTDTFTPAAAGGFLGTADGGDGIDTVVLATGNYSTNGVWKNIEKIQLGGDVTLNEAQLDNDSTFQITGGNHTVTVSVTSVDLSEVTFQAGNTSKFALTGTAAADTITTSAAADTVDGGDGADTITGGVGNNSITGGAKADTMTGGGGTDTFVFANGDSTKTAIDTITDYANGDKIDNGGTITTALNADAAGEATINASGLVTGFNGVAADYDTLDEKIGQVDKALGGVAEQAAVFIHGGETYLYISVGTDATNDGTDTVIKLTGVTAGNISITGGDIDGIG